MVEESLRFDAPVLGLFRTTTCPVTLHDETIPADAKVMLLYASANRDGAAFDAPDEFRLDRPAAELLRRHLGFGAGTGQVRPPPRRAALARLEARHALRAVIGRLRGLRPNGEAQRIAPFFLWGRRSLPVAWDPRGSARGTRGRVI